MSNEEKITPQQAQADITLEDEFIRQNYGLVKSVVVNMVNSNANNFDDIMQLGLLGMLKAMRNFNTTFNTKFSTYAIPMIIGEIKRYLRDNNENMLKTSRELKTINNKALYLESIGYTDEEICKIIGIQQSKLNESRTALQNVLWLDAVSTNGNLDHSTKEMNYYDSISNNFDLEQAAIDNITYNTKFKLFKSLVPDEWIKIYILRTQMDYTQVQTAEAIGGAQVQVSRAEKKIVTVWKAIERYNDGEITYSDLYGIVNTAKRGKKYIMYENEVKALKEIIKNSIGKKVYVYNELQKLGYDFDNHLITHIRKTAQNQLMSEGFEVKYVKGVFYRVGEESNAV